MAKAIPDTDFLRAAIRDTRRHGLPTPSDQTSQPTAPPESNGSEPGYRCIECHEITAGRFAARHGGSSRGWSRGSRVMSWYCWTCLPYGQAARPREPIAQSEGAR